MDDLQIIRAPNGDELVVLPRAAYEALLARAAEAAEDEDDVAIYDARKQELGENGQFLPAEVSAAMLKGASRLNAIRRWRGLSQKEISVRTGIGQGYLSDLENRRRAGTPATIEKLAAALDVPVPWLK